MIETITYKDKVYPAIQAQGFAAQYAFPFAKHYCKGIGFDIGCMKEEWAFPGSIVVDPALNEYDAMNLPKMMMVDGFPYDIPVVDYIFSSHCLEHLTDWVGALDYWATRIKSGGTLFLYLPNCDHQDYWRPWNNRKHLHYLSPGVMLSYFYDRRGIWSPSFITLGYDLNCSFYAIAEKL